MVPDSIDPSEVERSEAEHETSLEEDKEEPGSEEHGSEEHGSEEQKSTLAGWDKVEEGEEEQLGPNPDAEQASFVDGAGEAEFLNILSGCYDWCTRAGVNLLAFGTLVLTLLLGLLFLWPSIRSKLSALPATTYPSQQMDSRHWIGGSHNQLALRIL